MNNVFVYSITSSNVGDDLFMHILFERYPNARMVLYAPKTYEFFAQKFSNVVVVSDNDKRIKRLITISKYLHIPKTLLIYLYLFIKYKIELFLVIGGSLFMEGKSNIPSIMTKINIFKHFFPKLKVSIIGSNFGPCKSDAFFKSVEKALTYADDVCFRDKSSYNLFSKMPNVRWGNDIVLCSNNSLILPPPSPVEKRKRMCINIRSVEKWPTLKPYKDRYLNNILSLISFFQEKGYSISLLSFCAEYGDNGITDELYEMIKDKREVEKVYYDGNIKEIIGRIAESEYMIATRFHAIILSFLYNVSVYPISYSIKTENMLETLDVWDDVYDFAAFCDTSLDRIIGHFLQNVNIDKTYNTQFDWLDKNLTLNNKIITL